MEVFLEDEFQVSQGLEATLIDGDDVFVVSYVVDFGPEIEDLDILWLDDDGDPIHGPLPERIVDDVEDHIKEQAHAY